MMEQKIASFKKAICTTEGERLWFAEKFEDSNAKVYEVYNQSKNELLGKIERVRNGQWMHWSFVIPLYLIIDCANNEQFLTYSPGCLDEIREFCKKLNGRKKDD